MYLMDDLFCSIMYGYSDALTLFPKNLVCLLSKEIHDW